MPIVRVNDDGNKLRNWSRKVAMVAAGTVLAGLYKAVSGDPGTGLVIMVAGCSLSSIWNLADDS